MKKFYLVVIVSFLAIALCGCGHVDITCKVTEEHEAHMEIKLEVITEGFNAEEKKYIGYTLNELQEHWRDTMTQSQLIKRKSRMTLSGWLYKKADSHEAAYDALLGFMTSDVSPFHQVEGGFSPSYFTDKRYLKATIDLSQLVDMEFVEALPPSQRDQIMKALEQCTGKVIFDLPGDVIENTGMIEDGVVYQDITLSEPVSFLLTTEFSHIANKDHYDQLKATVASQEKDMMSLGIVIGCLLILLIVAIVLLCIAIKRRKVSNIKHGYPPKDIAITDSASPIREGLEDRNAELEGNASHGDSGVSTNT